VLGDKLRGEGLELSRLRHLLPLGRLCMPVEARQYAQRGMQRLGVREEIGVGVDQIAGAGLERGRDANMIGAQHRLPQHGRDHPRANFIAFGLDEHRARRVHRDQGHGDARLEPLLRWLSAGHPAQQRAAMLRQGLEIQHLLALGRQMGQQPGFRRSGPAIQQHHPQRQGRFIHGLNHKTAIGLVPPVDQPNPPADLRQDRGKRPRPLPAAPTIDQRTPTAGTIGQGPLKVGGGVPRHQRRAKLAGDKGLLLDIDGADLGALGIGQNRQRDRSGDVILGVFTGRAHVDDVVERQRGQRAERGERVFHGAVLSQPAARCQSRAKR